MNTLAPRTKARMDDFPEDDSLRGIILPDAWEGFSYGEVLEGYRTKQGLGLRKVAEAMGIYPSVLSRYENNQRGLSFDTADAFAAAIGVDPLELSIQIVRVWFHKSGKDETCPLYALGRTLAEMARRA